jgi:hypothetical protein
MQDPLEKSGDSALPHIKRAVETVRQYSKYLRAAGPLLDIRMRGSRIPCHGCLKMNAFLESCLTERRPNPVY